MTAQAPAQARLAAIRTRAGRRPANDLTDDLTTLYTPADIRAELDQLRAGYEIVNQQAKGQIDWDTHFAEFVRFADETRARTEGVLGWVRTSSATMRNIRARAQRLEEWKQALGKRGVEVREPAKRPPPESGGVFSRAIEAAPWVIGGLVVLQVLRR